MDPRNVSLPPSFFTKAALRDFSAIDHHLIRRILYSSLIILREELITEKRYSKEIYLKYVIYKMSNDQRILIF